MRTADTLDVFWKGEFVGSMLECEVETVGGRVMPQLDGAPRWGPLSDMKVHGRWTPADRPAAREFLSHLETADRCEVTVEPYSRHMNVLFSLSGDEVGWLYCRTRI